MRVSELEKRFGYEAVLPRDEDKEVSDAYTSDLLSDVMAKANENTVLITIQAHKNTIAVASLVGARAIVICNSRPIPDDMVEAARSEDVALFRTSKSQFEVSGELYKELRL